MEVGDRLMMLTLCRPRLMYEGASSFLTTKLKDNVLFWENASLLQPRYIMGYTIWCWLVYFMMLAQ